LKTKILSVDVGAYTQDILLWNGSYESAFKMILPSPTQIMAERVNIVTTQRKHLVVSGETMGGGLFNRALRAHLESGLNVSMTELAARTVRDDPERVQQMGIDIIDEDEVPALVGKEDTEGIVIKDVDANAIQLAASCFGIDIEPEVVAIGVEDHGTPAWRTGTSADKEVHDGPRNSPNGQQTDREIRFEHFKNLIPTTSEGFGFEEPPSHYTRMMGVKRTLTKSFPDAKHLIMDSKIAAVFGSASTVPEDRVVAVDVGNGHTTVASIEEGELTGIFEHHTGSLTREMTEGFITEFVEGTLTNETIFGDGGHGCYIARALKQGSLVVTGPKRASLFINDPPGITFINPYGDMMITGNVGLTECSLSKFDI